VILVPKYEKFKVKERCGAARASGDTVQGQNAK